MGRKSLAVGSYDAAKFVGRVRDRNIGCHKSDRHIRVLWVASFARVAKIAASCLSSSLAPFARSPRTVTKAAYARRGIKLELGERLALGYQFHIAASREQASREQASREQASREAAPHYEENMKMFGELRIVRALTDEQIAAMRDPRLAGTVKLPTIEDAVKAGGFLAGRPEDMIEALKAVEKRYPGLDRVICATPLGTPLDVQLEDLDRFAKEVIPAFRDTRTAAAAQ
jgi:hypothetical protein